MFPRKSHSICLLAQALAISRVHFPSSAAPHDQSRSGHVSEHGHAKWAWLVGFFPWGIIFVVRS